MARSEAQIPGLDARSVTFRPTGHLEPKNRVPSEDMIDTFDTY